MDGKVPEVKKKSNAKILIVEHDEALGQQIEHILTSEGYRVRRVNTSFGALAAIEGAEREPFAVVISNYRMPGMTGDELLANARSLSPNTQLVLMIDSLEIHSVVNAINRAGINSCIPVPFVEEMFLAEISQRRDYFNRIRKKERLLKVTRHQNRQLYQKALNLKEKKEAFARQIQEKKKLLQLLRGKDAQLLNREEGDYCSLEQLLQLKGIANLPEPMAKEFKSLSCKMKCFLKDVAVGSIELKDVDEQLFYLNNEVSRNIGEGRADDTSQVHHIEAKSLPEIPFNEELFGKMAGDPFIEKVCKGILSQETWIDKLLIDQLVSVFIKHESFKVQGHAQTDGEGPADIHGEEGSIAIVVSKDKLSASIGLLETALNEPPSLQTVKAVLKKRGIVYGIEEDTVIEEWLAGPAHHGHQLTVSKGLAPVEAVNAAVKFFFDVDFLHAAKVNSDGTMDFRDRGTIPFVRAGTLLAEKTPCKAGTAGIDIYGSAVTVEPPQDVLFDMGHNIRFSQDNLKMYATADGRPHLNAVGTVSVYPELRIDGDVDSETGNIDFSGNIVVSGTVKEGFSVRCANLTVDQIHGAQINITGNLNVSSGIIDSQVINVQGNIQAKYIKNSRLKAFENIIVQREIIDSQVFTGGECINEQGSISSSHINAKRGIRAGTVGIAGAAASKLEVGTEALMEMIIADLDERLEKNGNDIKLLKRDIQELQMEENMLHEKISNAAYVQDRSRIELREIQKHLPDMQASEDIEAVRDALEMVKELQLRAREAEEIINDAFEQQGFIVELSQEKQRGIDTIEHSNEAIGHKKRGMLEFSRRREPKAELTVQGTITAGTIIAGGKSRLTLEDEHKGVRIHEIPVVDSASVLVYKMQISDL